MTELCFPKDNEKEFIKVAEKLEIKSLVLVYPFNKNTIKENVSKLNSLEKNTKIKLYLGLSAKEKDIPKAKEFAKIILSRASTFF